MEFRFEIGTNERHQIIVQRNWFTGRLVISVDSQPVATQSPFNPATHISVKLTKKYDFIVGNSEKHAVRIEKIRPLLFPAFRPHTYRVFVDDILFKEHQAL